MKKYLITYMWTNILLSVFLVRESPFWFKLVWDGSFWITWMILIIMYIIGYFKEINNDEE